MKRIFEKVLKIYSSELAVFIWVSLLLLFISAASMLLDNFSETVFIKRYGVKKLPNIYMINAIITFFLMNYIIIIQRRLSTIQLLRYLFIVCSALVIAVRFLQLSPAIVYPLFYIFKTQFETLLLLLFWNLGNEIFNTRQAKRIFPAIMAADVLGRICGSAITNPVSSLLGIDNIVFAYGAFMLCAFFIAFYLERSLNISDTFKLRAEKELDTGILDEFKSLITLARQSSLFQILAVITLMSNLMIPLFNYQFSFILDHHFASEDGLLAFFSWFRSLFNGLSLVMLLFTGRFFALFGLTLAVLLHPFNYIFIFLALLLHFKLGSAIYGRLSSNVIRSVFNAPSLAAMMGLFPGNLGRKIRPLLRGTVVRLGVFGGSLILIITRDIVPAHMLSLLGIAFGLVWFMAAYRLRAQYARIVIDHLQKDMIDFSALEKADLKALLKDQRIIEKLQTSFQEERGEICVWYAELLRMTGGAGLKSAVLSALPGKEESAQRKLIKVIRDDLNSNDFPLMRQLEAKISPGARLLFLETMAGLQHEQKDSYFRSLCDQAESDELKFVGLLGLLKNAGSRQRDSVVREFSLLIERTTGQNLRFLMRIVGKTGVADLRKPLLDRYKNERDQIAKAHILGALSQLDGIELNDIAREILHAEKPVRPLLRRRALEAFKINDEQTLEEAFVLLDRSDRKTRRLILDKLGSSGLVSSARTLSCLSSSKSDIRDWALEFAGNRGVSKLELHNYIYNRLAEAYHWVLALSLFKRMKPHPHKDLLVERAQEIIEAAVMSILYLLELDGNRHDLRLLRRAVGSEDKRLRYNAVEALESMISPDLAKRLIPLIDDVPLEEKAEKGVKFFPLPKEISQDAQGIVAYLSFLKDPALNECLKTYTAQAYPELAWGKEPLFTASPPIAATGPRKEAGSAFAGSVYEHGEDSLLDRIAFLKSCDLFGHMKISELAAIAAILKKNRYAENQIILPEGADINALYLIFNGSAAVVKKSVNGGERVTSVLEQGSYFGETTLFEKRLAEAGVRAIGPCEAFLIEKGEFENLVDEFPRIALNMAKGLSKRLRDSHEGLRAKDADSLEENRSTANTTIKPPCG